MVNIYAYRLDVRTYASMYIYYIYLYIIYLYIYAYTKKNPLVATPYFKCKISEALWGLMATDHSNPRESNPPLAKGFAFFLPGGNKLITWSFKNDVERVVPLWFCKPVFRVFLMKFEKYMKS